MSNVLAFPTRKPSLDDHEVYYQRSLDTGILKACEAGFAMRKAMEPGDRECHLVRGVDALKEALFAAISASGVRNQDRALYNELVKGDA